MLLLGFCSCPARDNHTTPGPQEEPTSCSCISARMQFSLWQLPPYTSLGKISHWPRVVHNLPHQRWTFRPFRKPSLCFQTVGLRRNCSRKLTILALGWRFNVLSLCRFPKGNHLKSTPCHPMVLPRSVTLQIAPPQTPCLATYLPASPARAGYPQPRPASSFSPCSSAGSAELPRTEPQGKGEAEAGFLPVMRPLGHDPASSRGRREQEDGTGRMGIATLGACTWACKLCSSTWCLPSQPQKRTPKEAASSWCFAPCLWAPVFGWLRVRHNCPQWDTPSPSMFPASSGQNQLPPVFSTASTLRFP